VNRNTATLAARFFLDIKRLSLGIVLAILDYETPEKQNKEYL